MTREFDLIAAIRPFLDGDGPGVPVGSDDDAAVVEVAGAPVAVAVDTLVDGIHFDLEVSGLDDVGWKALAVNVSDVVAIAATPVAAVISLQRPDGFGEVEAEELYRGLREAADRWGVRLVGGDTVNGPCLTVSVTVLGQPVDPDVLVRRSGAREGDLVLVIGPLGLAAAGLELARAGATEVMRAHPDLLEAHRRPRPQLAALGALAMGSVNAAIDVSDGLGRDLGHVAAASGVRIRLDRDRLPVHAGVAAAATHLGVDPLEWVVGGGDDYAIAATVTPANLARVETALEASGVRARVIGEVVAGSGVVIDGDHEQDVSTRGWEHG